MSKTLKASLLTALVFPGLGHLVLNRPIHTIAYAGVSMVCIFKLIGFVSDVSQRVLDMAERGEIPADPLLISEKVHAEMAASSGTAEVMLWILGAVWLVALIDAIRIGRQMDKALAEETHNPAE